MPWLTRYRTGFCPLLIASALLVQCHGDPPENPYDDMPEITVELDATAPIPEGSFAWLHDRMFQATCANSGCHDGTFEPDFRTIGSAWNTLVNHPVISNDAAGSFTYRVVPGSVDESLLMKRLTTFIPNTSGMMPLEVDKGSDWYEWRDTYLEALTDWIANGAADINGNVAGATNLPSQITGFGGFASGSLDDPYLRNSEENYRLEIEAGPVDLWFAISDDSTPLAGLVASLRMANTPDSLMYATPIPLEQPFTFEAADFSGGISTYGHRVTLDFTGVSSTSMRYLQIMVDDGTDAIWVPSVGSQPYLTHLYSLYIP